MSNGAGSIRYTYTQAAIAEMTQGTDPRFILKTIEGSTVDASTIASQQFRKGTKYTLEEVGKLVIKAQLM